MTNSLSIVANCFSFCFSVIHLSLCSIQHTYIVTYVCYSLTFRHVFYFVFVRCVKSRFCAYVFPSRSCNLVGALSLAYFEVCRLHMDNVYPLALVAKPHRCSLSSLQSTFAHDIKPTSRGVSLGPFKAHLTK